jgi:hypothetical protein
MLIRALQQIGADRCVRMTNGSDRSPSLAAGEPPRDNMW